MNSNAEKVCLADPAAFRNKKGHRGLDWFGDPLPTLPLELEEADITGWLSPNNYTGITPKFRLLICAPRETGQEMTLPISALTYEAIAKAWKLPPMILCAIRQPYAFSSFFELALGPERDYTDRGTGLILRFDSHWECESTVVVCQHPSTKQITVFVAGLSETQIPRFLDLVLATAAESPHLLGNPTFVPIMLLSELCQNQTDWLELVAPDLNDIQRSLGMGNWKYASDSPLYGPNVVENLINLDLPGLMSSLNRMADSVRFQNQVALTLIEMLGELRDWLRDKDGRDGEEEGQRRAREEIGQTITLLSKSLQGCQRRVTYRRETIQGLMDTVFTLIAQRDNYLSLDVAFHTRRDSTDMRMIAAVTLFFLPGMFTATLFSTTFFDFQAPDDEEILSPYHWMYWMSTIVATGAVLLFWMYYTRKEQGEKTKLPDLMKMNDPKDNGIPKRSYNTTDIPTGTRRKRQFAGW